LSDAEHQDVCQKCGGVGYFRRDVAPDHPDFGRAIPCECKQREIEAQEQQLAEKASKQAKSKGRARTSVRLPPARDLASFSYSSLATFEQCPLRFKLRYVEGQNTDTGLAREHTVGSIVHATLHAFMDQEPDDRSLSCLEELFDGYWRKYWRKLWSAADEEEEWRTTAWRSVSQLLPAGYCGGKPRALERRFKFRLDDCEIVGAIDRIDEVGPGEYEVVDYKALEPPVTEKEALRDLQTVLYYFGAKSLMKGQAPVSISYFFLHHGAVITVHPSGTEMNGGLSKVTGLIQKIRSRRQFRPRRNQFCRNCVEFGKCSATRLTS
jgi:RecB family exonuclease